MKIHLQQIPEGGVHLEGQETADILELNDPTIRALQNVTYSLSVQVEKNNVLVTGQLSLELELECVSCLRLFHYPLVVPDFVYETTVGGRETIDLTPAIREDILLVLPSHPRCDWDGHSECPGLRIEKGTSIDSVPEASNAWDALDELNLKKQS
ncbi:MAG TPA: hypothetical protein VFO40_13260 [Chthoniobacterales bacterium]|jgi:uncharacterized metal-binding protein YceD (DUF177 family)|nr:hypothetical protein [Chthoniobacterales bacterium]